MTRPGAVWPVGETRLCAVIGDPVRHSLSPVLHNAAYAALDLDWAYVALPVGAGDAPQAIMGARALGIRGLSVTMPHKETAFALADTRSPHAERLAAANCLVFAGDKVHAEANDGVALLDDLHDAGFDPDGAVTAVIGAGGAARSVVLALGSAGAAEVIVVNRTAERAARAAALAGRAGRVGTLEDLGRAELVVQATPLGMAGGASDEAGAARARAFGARLSAGQFAYDCIYHPQRPPFLEAAAASGARTRNGIGMLVHVAAHQFAAYTGEMAPLPAMWAAVTDAGYRPD
jgi:shikimate dehydrogenase